MPEFKSGLCIHPENYSLTNILDFSFFLSEIKKEHRIERYLVYVMLAHYCQSTSKIHIGF